MPSKHAEVHSFVNYTTQCMWSAMSYFSTEQLTKPTSDSLCVSLTFALPANDRRSASDSHSSLKSFRRLCDVLR